MKNNILQVEPIQMCISTKKGNNLKLDGAKLIGTSTKSLYIRQGKLNGTLFLSQRGNGCGGAGDITKLIPREDIIVNENLFNRLVIYAIKAKAILN